MGYPRVRSLRPQVEKENLRSVYKQKVDEMRKAEQQLARKQREFEEMAACRQRDLAKAEDAEQQLARKHRVS